MKVPNPILSLAMVATAGVVLSACGAATTPEASPDAAAPTETTTTRTTDEMMEDSMEESMAEQNIVQTAQAAGSFETLLAAAEAAGLVETLSGPGPLTVFAPTDEAFDKLPAGTVEGLLEDPDQLAEILTYHVVSGEVTAAQVVELDSATTVQGSDVSISVEGGNVMVNDATVVQPDIMASNGVIHVIDTVLLPE